MRAQLCESLKELEAAGPGAILPARSSSGGIAALIHRCPGCGEIGSIPVQRPLGGDRSWRLSGPLTDPTLSPSIIHGGTKYGGCGWHGYLVSGEWKPAE